MDGQNLTPTANIRALISSKQRSRSLKRYETSAPQTHRNHRPLQPRRFLRNPCQERQSDTASWPSRTASHNLLPLGLIPLAAPQKQSMLDGTKCCAAGSLRCCGRSIGCCCWGLLQLVLRPCLFVARELESAAHTPYLFVPSLAILISLNPW